MDEISEALRHGYVRFPFKANHGGVDLWRRFEGAGRHRKSISHIRVVLDQHRKRAVRGRARLSDKALRNFLLNHHGYIQNTVAILDESFEERRCDVVGQIADEVKRSVWKVDFEGIALDDLHIRRHLRAESRNEVSIDFDRDNALDCSGEDLREASGARANFDDRVFRLQVCELHNTAEDGSISQEMLAEALLQFRAAKRQQKLAQGVRTCE